jgi:hypothetical protein
VKYKQSTLNSFLLRSSPDVTTHIESNDSSCIPIPILSSLQSTNSSPPQRENQTLVPRTGHLSDRLLYITPAQPTCGVKRNRRPLTNANNKKKMITHTTTPSIFNDPRPPFEPSHQPKLVNINALQDAMNIFQKLKNKPHDPSNQNLSRFEPSSKLVKSMQQLIESQSSPPPAAVMALPTTSPTIIPPNTFLNQRENTVGWTGGWSDEDHSIFLSGRAQYGNKWGEIAGLLRGKNIRQLEYHAQLYDKKFGKAKKDTVGSWSDEEHRIFLSGRAQYGNSWGKIAGLLSGKNIRQTKYHAQMYDKKFGKAKKDTVGSWSDEEHNIFLNGRARYGNSWGEIARLLRGKSDTQTKYYAQIYDKKFGKAKKDTVGSLNQRENTVGWTGGWSDVEHSIFLKAREQFGNKWSKIASLLKTKTYAQTLYHGLAYDTEIGKAKQIGKEGEMVYIKGLIDEGSASSNDIKWFEFEMRKLTTKGRPTAR